MWISTGSNELCSTPENTGEAEVLKVLLYSCQSTHTQVKEKDVKGKSRQLSALLGF